MMVSRWAIGAVFAVLTGCATTQGGSAAPAQDPAAAKAEQKPQGDASATQKPGAQLENLPPEEQRAALQKLFAREADPLPEQDVGGESFTFRLETKGSPTIERADESQEVVTADIGTDQPLTCIVADSYASATAFHEMLKNVAEETNVRGVRVREIDHVDGDPILHGEIIYSPKSSPRSIGLVKVAVASGPRGGLLCTHDEPGYAKTFTRMVRTAFGSLKLKDAGEEPKALWSELQVATAQKTTAGYERRDLYDNDDGFVLVTRMSAAIFPSVDGAIALDSRSEEYMDAKGQLIGHKYVEVTGGEVTAELELSRQKNGDFTYEGTHKGAKVTGKVKTTSKTGLSSEMQAIREVRKLIAAKKKAEAKIEVYTPSETPAETQVLTLRPGKTPGTIEAGEGDDAFVARVAPDGTFSKREFAGQLQVSQERVFSDGEWPKK